jgi:hypothetical protein
VRKIVRLPHATLKRGGSAERVAQTLSKTKSEPKRANSVKRENSVVKRKTSCKRTEAAGTSGRVSVVRRPTLKRSDSRSQFHRMFVSDVVATPETSISRSGNCGKLLKFRGISVDRSVYRKKAIVRPAAKSWSHPVPMDEGNESQYAEETSPGAEKAAAADADADAATLGREEMNSDTVSDAFNFDEVDAVSSGGRVATEQPSSGEGWNEERKHGITEKTTPGGHADERYSDVVDAGSGTAWAAEPNCDKRRHENLSSAADDPLDSSQSRKPIAVSFSTADVEDKTAVDRLLSGELPVARGQIVDRTLASRPPIAESTPKNAHHHRHQVAPTAITGRLYDGSHRRVSAGNATDFAIDSDYESSSSSSSSSSDVEMSPQANSFRLSPVSARFSFCSDRSDISSTSTDISSAVTASLTRTELSSNGNIDSSIATTTASSTTCSSSRCYPAFEDVEAISHRCRRASAAAAGATDGDLPPPERRRVTLPRREKPVTKDAKRPRSGTYVTMHGLDDRQSELQRLGSERRVRNLKSMFETNANVVNSDRRADGGCMKRRGLLSKESTFRKAVSFECPCSPDDAQRQLDDDGARAGGAAPSHGGGSAATSDAAGCVDCSGGGGGGSSSSSSREALDNYGGTRPRSFTVPTNSRRNCSGAKEERRNYVEKELGRRTVNSFNDGSSDSPTKRTFCILDSDAFIECPLAAEVRRSGDYLGNADESTESPSHPESVAHRHDQYRQPPNEMSSDECISVIAWHRPTEAKTDAATTTATECCSVNSPLLNDPCLKISDEFDSERRHMTSVPSDERDDTRHDDGCHDVVLTSNFRPTDGDDDMTRDDEQVPSDEGAVKQPTMAAFYCHFSQICRSLQTVEIARHKPQQTL